MQSLEEAETSTSKHEASGGRIRSITGSGRQRAEGGREGSQNLPCLNLRSPKPLLYAVDHTSTPARCKGGKDDTGGNAGGGHRGSRRPQGSYSISGTAMPTPSEEGNTGNHVPKYLQEAGSSLPQKQMA